MKTELDLLVESLQRLNHHYQQRDQQVNLHLNALATQLDQLVRQINNLTTHVVSLTSQLKRFQSD